MSEPYSVEDLAEMRANVARPDSTDFDGSYVSLSRWLATVDAARASALEWFDRWVEAVREATGIPHMDTGDEMVYSHAFLSEWEAAWATLGLTATTVTAAEFNEAVACKRAEVGGR